MIKITAGIEKKDLDEVVVYTREGLAGTFTRIIYGVQIIMSMQILLQCGMTSLSDMT